MCGEGQLVSSPGHWGIDVDVARFATRIAGGNRNAGSTQIRLECRRANAAICLPRSALRNDEVGGVNQPSTCLACNRCSRHFNDVGNLDVRGAGFNKPAVAALGRAGVQRAGHMDRARRHAGQQGDGACTIFDGMRLNDAGVVHHAG